MDILGAKNPTSFGTKIDKSLYEYAERFNDENKPKRQAKYIKLMTKFAEIEQWKNKDTLSYESDSSPSESVQTLKLNDKDFIFDNAWCGLFFKKILDLKEEDLVKFKKDEKVLVFPLWTSKLIECAEKFISWVKTDKT